MAFGVDFPATGAVLSNRLQSVCRLFTGRCLRHLEEPRTPGLPGAIGTTRWCYPLVSKDVVLAQNGSSAESLLRRAIESLLRRAIKSSEKPVWCPGPRPVLRGSKVLPRSAVSGG